MTSLPQVVRVVPAPLTMLRIIPSPNILIIRKAKPTKLMPTPVRLSTRHVVTITRLPNCRVTLWTTFHVVPQPLILLFLILSFSFELVARQAGMPWCVARVTKLVGARDTHDDG